MKHHRAIPALALAFTMTSVHAAPEQLFTSDWESLKQYRCPEWFRDAKFGIWSHWGPQSVPEGGDWYARNMYVQGHGAYELHLRKYGHPSKVGYKDVVAQWKAEKFDPAQADRLMRLYKQAGAKYFVSMGVHHDNFDLWNSKHHKWNAVNMGPKKDIVGIWAEAARRHGLRFGVSEHLERSYSWFNTNKGSDKTGPLAGVPYDGNDPEFADYYFPPHADDNMMYPKDPPEWWTHQWRDRINDLVESYQPDLLYTDGAIPFGEVGRGVVANFYNKNRGWHGGRLEAVYNIKEIADGHGDYVEGVGVKDMERGVVPKIEALPWQTDTSIGDWFYNPGWKYRPTSWTIHMLMDIVSKNGNLLLNVVQKPDGTIEPEAERMLGEMAAWTTTHGEAVFGTRPWRIFGESVKPVAGGHHKEDFTYTAKDIRFTTRGETLYAIALGWPEDGKLLVRSLAKGAGDIQSISLLGHAGKLDWQQTGEGLAVQLPPQKVSGFTAALKITGRDLKPVPFIDPAKIARPDSQGVVRLEATMADLDGTRIRMAEAGGKPNIGWWSEPADVARWHAEFHAPGTYKVTADMATVEAGEIVMDLAGSKATATIPVTGSWYAFKSVELGTVEVKKAGVRTMALQSKDAQSWRAINLRSLVLSPVR